MLRIIREEEPPKPSTRLSSSQSLASIAALRRLEPKRLTTLVAGELDWIVLKALEKDRNRRYETAIGFVRDIQRYLADEPVEARPPSAWYRFRKFARRNRGPLAAAAVLGVALLAVLGATAGSIGWAVRAREARQARLTGQVETILEDVARLEQEQKWPEALARLERAEAVLAAGEAGDAIQQRVGDARQDLTFIAELDHIREERAANIGGKLDLVGFVSVMPTYAEAFRAYGVDVEALPAEESSALLERNPTLAAPIAVGLDDWVDAWLVLRETEPGWKKLVAVARALDHDPVRDRLRAMWGQPITPELQAELQRLAESIDVKAQRPATLHILAQTLNRAHLSAMRILQSGQQAHPADYWLNIELGQAMGYYDAGSLRYFSVAVALRPDSAWAHFALGGALKVQQKLEEAIAERRKASELEPKWSYARLELGMHLFEQGEMDAAMVEFRKCIELHPKSPWACFAHSYLGDILRDKGNLDEAIAEYREAIELKPNYFLFHDRLGYALFANGRRVEAIAEYRKAVDLAPKYALAHYHLGNALRQQGYFDDAIVELRKSIELDPKSAVVHYDLGIALKASGDLDGAEAAYRETVRLDGNHHGAAIDALVALLLSRGNAKEAIATCQAFLALEPEDAGAHYLLGDALQSDGKEHEANDQYHEAFRLAEENPDVGNHLAMALNKAAWTLAIDPDAQKRDLSRALKLAEQALELAPKNGEYWNSLGVAQYRDGQCQSAIDALQQSIQLRSGGDPTDWFFLAMAYWQLGQKDEARQWYDRGVRWMKEHDSKNQELQRFEDEASKLLKIEDQKPSKDG